MSYTSPILQVITGTIVIITLTYSGPTTGDHISVFLFFGGIFALGMFVAVHGLFQGIEAAVAAAIETDEKETGAE
ncbi:hypothetical protein [Halorhabdus sp. SVX81]|uniref:hypothetical protein n=1 Tax=Halorhabdus sp. SVX81 TaxID=2978283 RepID=UPI0023DB43E8|nr:hypothetical protein [Halorhabdus sp. SVX81]